MAAQVTTSASDAFLALSAFHAAYSVYGHSSPAVIGFLLVGFAATAGVFRFGLQNPGNDLILYHRYLSWLASVLGMSCLAASYHRLNLLYSMASVHLACGLALTFLSSILSNKIHNVATEIVSSGAIVSIFLLSLIRFNPFGLIGAGIYAVSGLVIGTEGNFLGLPRVDFFHYGLVVGNIALMMGVLNQGSPIYYKPSI